MSVIVLKFIVSVGGADCGYLFRGPKNVAAPLVGGIYGKLGWSGWHSCRVFNTSHVTVSTGGRPYWIRFYALYLCHCWSILYFNNFHTTL